MGEAALFDACRFFAREEESNCRIREITSGFSNRSADLQAAHELAANRDADSPSDCKCETEPEGDSPGEGVVEEVETVDELTPADEAAVLADMSAANEVREESEEEPVVVTGRVPGALCCHQGG